MHESFGEIFPVLLIVASPFLAGAALLLFCHFVGVVFKAIGNMFRDKPKPEKVRQEEFLDNLLHETEDS